MVTRLIRSIVSATLLLLLLAACGDMKGRLRISGQFENLPQADLLLYSPDGAMSSIDTLHIVKGKFDYQTPLPDDGSHTFVVIYPNFSTLSFMARAGQQVRIEGDALSLGNVTVEGADSILPKQTAVTKKSPLAVGKKFPKNKIIRHEPGTYLLVSFWADWKYGSSTVNYNTRRALTDCPDSLQAFTYSLDIDPAATERRRTERSDTLRWKTYCDHRGWQGPLLAKLGIRNIPLMVLVGPDGNIVAMGSEYNKDIKPHLPKKTSTNNK